ncbi:MAG: hypothetical protein ACOC0M_10720, partial [Halomonas sp.]
MPLRDLPSRRFPRCLAVALVGLAPLSLPATFALAEGLPVTAITLSSGGLAEVERRATLEGDGTLHLDVPLEHVDDVLKSLVVRDPEGRLRGLSLDGLATQEETFRRLPFGPEDLGSVARLAATLQGVEVRASAGGQRLEGRVLGVDERRDEEGRVTRSLSLLDAEGAVVTLRLADDARLELLD